MYHSHTKIMAITNQKGGVGKTTTTINLAAALAELGKKILIIDIDPQGNASTGYGIFSENRTKTSYDVIFDGMDIETTITPTSTQNVYIIPATTDLSSADVELVENNNRIFLLKTALKNFLSSNSDFDYIIFDCPPSLNLLTINALVASNSVLVPLQSEFFALEGLSQLMLTIREIRHTANNNLRIEGVVLTMFDQRNNLSQQVEEDSRENLGELVFQTRIPRNVRISEAPSFSIPVLEYDSNSTGAKAYRALAHEFLSKNTAAKD